MTRFLLAACGVFSLTSRADVYNLRFNTPEKLSRGESVAVATAPAPQEYRWRVGLGSGYAYEDSYVGTRADIGVNKDGSRYYYDTFGRGTPMAVVSLGYFPRPRLGFHGYFAVGRFPFVGAEVELTPIVLDIVELGLMLGATSLGRSPENIVAVHAGARLAVNVTERWVLAASSRANWGFVSLEGGLAYRY